MGLFRFSRVGALRFWRGPGALLGTLGMGLVIASSAFGAGWSVQTVPRVGFRTGSLSGVSCASRSWCLAVGNPVQIWTGRRWVVSHARGSQVGPAVCTSRWFCMSFGDTGVARWNGRRWSHQRDALGRYRHADISTNDGTCVSARDCVAVGENDSYSESGGSTPVAEHWNGKRWRVQQVQVRGWWSDSALDNVSCGSARSCLAVGYDGNINLYPLVERWSGTRWRIIPGPGRSSLLGSPENWYWSGVSCWSAEACLAVAVSAGGRPVAARWNGVSWSVEAMAVPRGARRVVLTGVSCSGGGHSCTVVGRYSASKHRRWLLAERWSGGHWSVKRIWRLVPGGDGGLDASCTTAGFCALVGTIPTSATGQTFAIAGSWRRGRWSLGRSAKAWLGATVTLNGVSCSSSTSCAAVGAYDTSPSNGAGMLALMWNGLRWTVRLLPHAVQNGSVLKAASCISSTFCVAVGYQYKRRGSGLVMRWDGHRWRSQANSSGRIILTGVSCVSITFCMATGVANQDDPNQRAVAERWDGKEWSPTAPLTPVGGTHGELDGVSCTSSDYCFAVGGYASGLSGPSDTLIERWDGASWTIESHPTSASSSGPLTAVSCPADKACTAVGATTTTGPLAEHWDGTSWRIQTLPSGWITTISCPGIADCIAAGANLTGQSVAAAQWDGTSWFIQSSASEPGQASSVSCSSASACFLVGTRGDGGGIEPIIERFS